MRFSEKVVVVTGAAAGIGAETAQLFAKEGATVFIGDIDDEGGQRLASDADGDVRFKHCDVCKTTDIKALMDHAAEVAGGIDILFTNAGAGGARETIDLIDEDGWDRTMVLLLRSVAMSIRHAVPHMKARAGASIINISSISAKAPGYAPTAYSVAKAGVAHLTKVAAADLAQFGIRVNAVQPGFIDTNIFTSAMHIPEEQKQMVKDLISSLSAAAQPVRRGGVTTDVAEACAYLASEAGSFVNGTVLLIDGGLTIGPRYGWDPGEPGLFDELLALEQSAKSPGESAE